MVSSSHEEVEKQMVPNLGTITTTTTTSHKEMVVVPWDYYYLLTLGAAHLNKWYQTLGPLGVYGQMRQLQDLLSLLRNNDVIVTVYCAAELGVIWKGRVQRLTQRPKTSIYRAVELLVDAGMLEKVDSKNEVLKRTVRIEKSAVKTRTIDRTGEAYKLTGAYAGPLTGFIDSNTDMVPSRIKERVRENLAYHARIQGQGDLFKETTDKPEHECAVPYCRRSKAYKGYCLQHYDASRR